MPAHPSPIATADVRAALASAWDRAGRTESNDPAALPLVTLLTDAPVPPGFAAWRVGPSEGGSIVALPALHERAPFDVWRRYLTRVVANASGTCPLCGAAAGLSADPERSPASWRVAPVTVGITHEAGCGALFGDDDREHFDPRAVPAP